MLLTMLAIAGRVCVGLVFLLSAAQKMRSWTILPGVIFNYQLLPRGLVRPTAVLLPPVELALGMALLSGLMPAGSALAASVLLMVFAAAMSINLGRGRAHIDCGCGQSFLRQPLSPVLVARNAVLALLLGPSLLATGSLSFASVLTGVSAGIAFFLLYLLTNVLVALPRPGRALAV
jgi:hypothetical protein